jgi:hypothetical protein
MSIKSKFTQLLQSMFPLLPAESTALHICRAILLCEHVFVVVVSLEHHHYIRHCSLNSSIS